MRAIWKFQLAARTNQLVMPKDAQVLAFQFQDNKPCIWALCETDEEWPKQRRVFNIVGTGHEQDDLFWRRSTYLGTAQVGILVWHLFEETT